MDAVAAELCQLKQQFGKDCKVIDNIGDFSHVIKVSLSAWDVNIKFQLTESYPEVVPAVIVTSTSLPPVTLTGLQTFVQQYSETPDVQCTISSILQDVSAWLTENGATACAGDVSGKTAIQSSRKQRKENQSTPNKSASSKKRPMKTAEDVIKRIQWDANLKADDFTVGYLDRFRGIIEKGFTAFSWEDLASVDYTVLAIPKHRIQYFRYKDLHVWDKATRLDRVFGSTGSGVTITDVVDRYDEFCTQDNVTTGSCHVSAADSTSTTDDSDDDVQINLDVRNAPETGLDDDDLDHYCRNKSRPNYFLCQRITEPEILEGVEAMQGAILDRDSRYAECCIRPVALHVTLCTLGLDSVDAVTHACQVLRDSRDQLADMARNNIRLRVAGVDNFFQRVVYARVNHSADFVEFAERVRLLMRSAGIEIRDAYDFTPHMTILKVTRPAARLIGNKKVASWMYDDFHDMAFGEQRIDAIHLCSMQEQRGTDGFYMSPIHIDLL